MHGLLRLPLLMLPASNICTILHLPLQLCSLVGKLKVTNSLGLHRPISYFYITTYLVWKWSLAWSLLTAMWACFLQSVWFSSSSHGTIEEKLFYWAFWAVENLEQKETTTKWRKLNLSNNNWEIHCCNH